MTNEELVERVQAGDTDLLPVLWEQVERFVAQQARRYAPVLGPKGGVTDEDLYQCGYFALIKAVDTFDVQGGKSFIGWLMFALKTAFVEAAGCRTTRSRADPLRHAASLSAPTLADTDVTLESIVPDPTDAYEAAEDRIQREALKADMDAALATLPDSGDLLRKLYYEDKTLAEVAAEAGVPKQTIHLRRDQQIRAIRRSKHCAQLQRYLDWNTDFYAHVGVKRFSSTHTSAVEALVIRREQLARQYTEGVTMETMTLRRQQLAQEWAEKQQIDKEN